MSDTDEAVIALERKTRARNLSEIDRRTGPDGAIGICCHMHKHLRRELALYTTPSNETLTMLRITVHDDFKPVTLQVEGRVAEPSLDVLEDCWRSAVAERRAVRIDLRAVTFVDAAGKECLARMHRQGAELIAAGCEMTHIVTEIMRCSPRD